MFDLGFGLSKAKKNIFDLWQQLMILLSSDANAEHLQKSMEQEKNGKVTQLNLDDIIDLECWKIDDNI